MYEVNLQDIVEENFGIYAGMVIQQRAIVDVRDCIKPSARQLMYAQLLDKITWKNKYQKSLKSVGSGTSHFYVHGDSSAYGTLIRMGKPFVMRYPLEDVQGSFGDQTKNGNEAASRYTEMRLHTLSSYLFELLDKDTIDTWFDNYDNTEIFPSVLPSSGYYNIVNGTMGIGVALASSIPQFNLKEVNNALITLLNNPDSTFEELYCAPDFATGGFMVNEEEVKESLRLGNGKACKLRGVVEYDQSEHCLIISELPYGVYTSTICGQLADMLEKNPSCGIEKFIDLTKIDVNIKIKLTKNANPVKVIKTLLKETNLQYHYSINMVMLDNGTNPKVFGWKEALSAHLVHEKIVLRNSLNYDKSKYEARLHIVEGLLIAIARIEGIIRTIKLSVDGASAKKELMAEYGLSELQSKAILDLKLIRLANMEAIKIENEKDSLIAAISNIENILSDEILFNAEIEKRLREVMSKFGDDRRTQILSISGVDDDEDEEPIETKSLMVHLTNLGNLYATETITLTTQKRGGKGAKIKLGKDEYIINSISNTNNNNCLFFTNKGKVYTTMLNNIALDQRVLPSTLFEMDATEKVTNICSFDKISDNEYIVFTTKNGMVKKSALSEYKIKRGKGVIAIKLKEDDSIVNISFVRNESLGILTKAGNFVIIDTETINKIGRVTAGVIGIKLNKDDEVIDAKIIPVNAKEIISISNTGLAKRTSIDEFSISTRGNKGSLIQKFKDGDCASNFETLNKEKELIIVSNKGTIKIEVESIQLSSRSSQGVAAKKLENGEKINAIIKEKL